MEGSIVKAVLLFPYFLLGYALTGPVRRSGRVRWGDALIAAIAFMVFIPASLGRSNRNFSEVMMIASGIALAAAVACYFLFRKRVPREEAAVKAAFDWPLLLFVLISSVFVGLASFHVSIHDETSIQSHPAVIERILRDGLPAGLMSFPELPLKYHYGFNILAAVWADALTLPAWVAIDVVSILLWIATAMSLADLLTTLGLPRRLRVPALIWVLLGAGWLWIVAPGVWQHGYLNGRHMKPMLISLFFQHPVALGLPLFFSGLDAWIAFRRGQGRAFFFAAVFLGGVLSLAQIVLFASLGALIGMESAFQFLRSKGRARSYLLSGAAAGLLLLALGRFLGGFFAPSDAYAGGALRFTWPPGFLAHEFFARGSPLGWGPALLWYVLNFGPPLLLFPFAVRAAWKQRDGWPLLLLALALGCFLFPQFFQYRLSWDVMKFFMVFDLAARVAMAAVFFPLLGRSWWRWFLAAALIASSSVEPVAMLGRLALSSYEKLPRQAKGLIGQPHETARRSVEDLLPLIRSGASARSYVLADPNLSKWISVYTGQAVLEFDQNTVAFGLKPALLQARKELAKSLRSELRVEALRAANVGWVVMGCAEYESLPAAAQGNVQAGLASGALRLISQEGPGKPCLRSLQVLR